MGWKIPISLENYSLYTFGRLASIFCLAEFKRRTLRALSDHVISGRSSIRNRYYLDFLILIACLTGLGWCYLLLFFLSLYTLLHKWDKYSDISITWRQKLVGAFKPLKPVEGITLIKKRGDLDCH